MGRDLIYLVKEEIAQPVMDEDILSYFKCLGLMSLTAADDHRTGIG